MFISRMESGVTPKPSTSYSFTHQEQDYHQFRPKWSKHFALAALQRLGFQYDDKTNRWLGLPTQDRPVIVSMGSGAGSDAEAFLQLGCIVYGVEPNAEFRQLATRNLGSKYPGLFFSVDGTAHQLNLPTSVKPDLLVCAQALHTFRSDVLHFASSEALARKTWKTIFPDGNQDRISIWYYNLDPLFPAVPDLDERLRKVSPSYANSKTTFLYSPLFEPSQFQYYISADKMSVSSAQPVDQSRFNFESVKKWLKSFSFYPKDSTEEARVLKELSTWFKLYKNTQNEIELNYIGFITQGPLRTTPYFQNQTSSLLLPPSPLTPAQRRIGINCPDFWPTTDLDVDKSPYSIQPDPVEICVPSSASKRATNLWNIVNTFTKVSSILYSAANTVYESLPASSVESHRQPVSFEPPSLAENALLALAFSPLIRNLLPWWFKPAELSKKDLTFLQEQQKSLQEYQKKFPTHSFDRAKKLGILVAQFSGLSTLMKSTDTLIAKTLKNNQISSSDMSTIIHNMEKINKLFTKLSNPKLSHELRKAVRHKSIQEKRMARRKTTHRSKKALQHLGMFSQSKNQIFEPNQLQRQYLILATGFRQIENPSAQPQLINKP